VIGSKLLHYEITGKLGEGGMGEVYRATDTRLRRDVAIKMLPADFADDPERLARFEREAQVLAALSHPNIAGIHGLELASPKPGESEQRFLVLELVEGKDLSEKLADGPLSVEVAFAVADQIALGLAAAHDAGIIHRDLKPANIKITPDGRVKILDFGLAKALDAPTSDAHLSQSPTLSGHMTSAGMIMGTAGYMSPEQARGNVADKSSDVWSFGVVLYEMLTGARAFTGSTVSDILASVLKDNPELDRLPAEVSVGQRWVLRRCLEREPAERLRDLGDVKLLLGNLPGPPAESREASMNASPKTRWVPLAAAVFAGLVAGRLITQATAPVESSLPAPLRQYTITTPELDFGSWSSSIAISPDGEMLAIETHDGIRTQRLSETEPRSLPIPENTREPFFSPDGSWLGYKNDESGTLEKIFLDGGSPMRLFDELTISNQGSWSVDGTIYYGGVANGEAGLHAVSETEGARRLVHAVTEYEVSVPFADVLPDGKHVLVSVFRSDEEPGSGAIELLDLERNEQRVLFEGATQARYSATGHLIAVTGQGVLSAIPFDEKRLEVTGPPRRLVTGVRTNHADFNANFAISQTGTLAFVAGDGLRGFSDLAFIDRQCAVEKITSEPQWFDKARLSPDGRYVLAEILTLKSSDIWLVDVERRTSTRVFVSPEGHRTRDPIWFPDSRTFAYTEVRDFESGPVLKSGHIAGTMETVLLSPSGGSDGSAATDVLPDESGVLIEHRDARGNYNIALLRDDTRTEIVVGERHQYHARVSPDGSSIAFVSNTTGQFEIYARPLEDPTVRSIPVSTRGGRQPMWGPSGEELLFFLDGTIYSADVERKDGLLSVSAPAPFCPDVRVADAYDVARDGARVLVRVSEGVQTPTTEVRVIENWPALLEQN